MIPKLEAVTYVDGYKIHVRFEDGAEGEIDILEELWGEVFVPLRDLGRFRRLRLDKKRNTVTWPSGADLAPEWLYVRVVRQRSMTDRSVSGS